METLYTKALDHETGVAFVHTARIAEDGTAYTTRRMTMLDQLANATRCRLEAGWLRTMVDHRMDKSDPEIERELIAATERGTGTEPLPSYLREVNAKYVYSHINSLDAYADRLEACADFNQARISQ